MFSILIPTYNFVCVRLVNDLHEQAERLGVPYEILVADDASTAPETVAANEAINTLAHCTFYRETVNVGRAYNCNHLAERAQFPYLIFIDSDAEVASSDFLHTYFIHKEDAPIVCGGVKNVQTLPSPSMSLRFRYEREADKHRLAAQRQKHPYAQFTTFNVLLRRDTFLGIRFDENCTQYGYEDALFGVELKHRQIPVRHIDNALIHNGLEENSVFLHKSEIALETLHSLGENMKCEAAVSRLANRLKKLHLTCLFRLYHHVFGTWERRNLLGTRPSLFLFSLYKLGYYLDLETSEK